MQYSKKHHHCYHDSNGHICLNEHSVTAAQSPGSNVGRKHFHKPHDNSSRLGFNISKCDITIFRGISRQFTAMFMITKKIRRRRRRRSSTYPAEMCPANIYSCDWFGHCQTKHYRQHKTL